MSSILKSNFGGGSSGFSPFYHMLQAATADPLTTSTGLLLR